jgi:ribosomal protein S18 acetylase RimI-like enzyme
VSTVDFGGCILSRVTEDDAAGIRSLQTLLESDAATWAALEGLPPRADEARSLVTDRPASIPLERKFIWIWGTRAVVDIVEGYPDPTTWYLGLIFIAPSARGSGLGTKLMQGLVEHVRARGGTAVRLAVVTTNTGARRLYDRLGFAHIARRPRALWHGDTQECDVLELAV